MAYYKCGQVYVSPNSNVGILTASGAIANFITDLALPLKSLKVEIKPKQASGTPTPSNPLPISGTDTVIVKQTGKNLFDKTKIKIAANRYMKYGVDNYSDSVPNGSLKLNGNTKYTISISAQAEGIAVYDKTGTQISVAYNTTALTFTPSNSGAYFIYIYISSQTWSGSWDDYNIQLEVGNQATTYEAYTAITKTVSLPSTVFGGEVDVIGGSGESNYTLANLSDLSWENAEQSGKTIFYAVIADKINNVDNIAYCEIFASATSSGTSLANAASLLTSDFMICTSKNTTNPRIYVRADGYTGAQFDNAISGYKVAYQLATPTPITLANPIDLTAKAGVNNVFGDTADVELQYKKIIT